MTRILVADDDEIFRSLVTEILTEKKYEVVLGKDGLDAWQKLEKEGADLAVLDINMPRMDGFELCRKIRESPRFKFMPILFLTIRGLAQDQVSGYDIGADEYIVKPFERDIFLARIKHLEAKIPK